MEFDPGTLVLSVNPRVVPESPAENWTCPGQILGEDLNSSKLPLARMCCKWVSGIMGSNEAESSKGEKVLSLGRDS